MRGARAGLAALLATAQLACDGASPSAPSQSNGAAAAGGQTSDDGASSTEGGLGGRAHGSSPDAMAGAGGTATTTAWYACQDSDQAFVRRAIMAALGRRPLGQAEVDVYTDLVRAVDALDGIDAATPAPPPGADVRHGRRVALRALAARDEYVSYWADAYRDALRVQRVQESSGLANPSCYGRATRERSPTLAAFVRDRPATSTPAQGVGDFTMHDLITSSLALDDVSPMYLGNAFAMLAMTYPGANVPPDKLEAARRSDFGAWFDAVYVHRDGVCLTCHNSEASVTFDADPEKNRFYPLPGKLEKALFGESTGVAPDDKSDGIARMHGMLRFAGFVGNGEARPWGWSTDCGVYAAPGHVVADVSPVTTRFGSVSGTTASAWDTTASLQAGFAKLRAHGLTRGPGGDVADPDEAFAYLVSANISELVWKQVVGTPLTIANYFPRNQAARDQLLLLTEGFLASGYSHERLLELIAQSPYFNLLAPDAGCGDGPYATPAAFDPWVKAERDPSRRGNSLGDGVAALPSRVAMRAAYAALEWQHPPTSAFPDADSEEGQFQGEIGVFLKNAEPGFRGFDFQARLGWEARMGSCTKPDGNTDPDVIDAIVARGRAAGAATVRELVAALKDRIIGEATIEEEGERPALESMLGANLDADAASLGKSTDAALRRVCGVLVASPQFLLGGVVPRDATGGPRLTPSSANYSAICATVAGAGLTEGLRVACKASSLDVVKK